jgi:hypothetical protein
MRIEFSVSGGVGYFPGLNKPVIIDVDQLDTESAEELKRRIEAARFFDLPPEVGSPAPGAADYQHNVLTVDDDGRRHTVRVLVPAEDPALQELIQTVQKYAKAARAAARGAPSDQKTTK